MKNKEFLSFLIDRQSPPQLLRLEAKKDIALSFRGKNIVLKFLFFQLLGALFSMSVCPQFGLGLVEGHGITHVFRTIGDWACAAFCGSLFLSSGMFLAFVSLPGEEIWWIWRRYKLPLVFLPAMLWSMLMLTNISLALPGESALYHMTWILMAIAAESFLFSLRSFSFRGALKE